MPERPVFMPFRSSERPAGSSPDTGPYMAGDFFNSLLGLRARLTYAGGVCGRWAIDHDSDRAIWFHLVTQGSVWVHSPQRTSPLQLDEGDLVAFLPHAPLHYFSYSPHELVFGAEGAAKTSWDQGGAAFVCAVVDLGLTQAGFWRALRAEIVIRSADAQGMLAELLRLIVAEAHQYRFGSFSIVERLCDSVFVLTLRHCVERGMVHDEAYRAMQDRRLLTVLSLIHREPWHPWTVAKLGARSGLSKTALTDKFTQVMGCPRRNTRSVAHANRGPPAEGIDAGSRDHRGEVWLLLCLAFSRTFKRCLGVAPGVYRQLAPSMPGFGAQRNGHEVAHDRRRAERRTTWQALADRQSSGLRVSPHPCRLSRGERLGIAVSLFER